MSYYGYEAPNDFRNYLMHAREKQRRYNEEVARGDRYVNGAYGFTYTYNNGVNSRDGISYQYHLTPQSYYRTAGDTDENRRSVVAANETLTQLNRNGGRKRSDNLPIRLSDGSVTSDSSRTLRERDLERQRRNAAARRQLEEAKEKERREEGINTRRAQREAAAAQAQRIHARRQQILAREEAVNNPGAQRAREEQERARRNRRK